MFENEVTSKALEDDGKVAAAYDDEGGSVRRRHRNHGNDRDKKRKKLSKQRHANSSDHAHKNEQIRKRGHSKKSKYRYSDEEDDDDSHSHAKKSKKKGHKKHKKSERRRDKNDNESFSLAHIDPPMDNNKILHNDQTIDTNPTTNNDLPQNAACLPKNTNTNPEPVRRTPSMIPMTRQQYEQKQSQIRSVYDPVSGRVRQIRGSGEIVETIVTRSQHTRINQVATQTDGQYYSQQVWNNAARQKR